ncbi:recombinase family protein [Aerococcaceae bacterium 50-4]
MRTAIYVRVSTQEQANEGYSVGEQEERLKAYCLAKGWTVYKVYTDGGFSGANTERPALKQMLVDIKNKKINAVVVYKLDRLSRSQKDTLLLIEDEFLKNNVEFVSMSENFDTSTPFGRAMIGILSVFAQLEREQIRERMQMGADARAKEGLYHGGGFDPIGYDYIDGYLQINEYEAMQVKLVHEMFLKGVPITRIQKIMNAKYTTKYGSWGSHTAVRSALISPIYTGKIEWKGELYDGKHEAIIDEETFNKSVKRYEEISWTKGDGKHKKRPFQAKHVLTGLVQCNHCGARYFAKGSYSGHGDKRTYRPYYTCYSRAKTAKNMIIDPNCKNTIFAVVKLDKIIFDEIKKLSFNPDVIKDMKSNKQEPENNNAAIESRISEIDKQVKRLIDLYQMGTTAVDDILSRVDELNAEKERLTSDLEVFENDEPELSFEEATNLLTNASDILDNGDLIEKREFVHSLINSIEIDDGDIIINWAFV